MNAEPLGRDIAVESRASAKRVGLTYVSDQAAGISRTRAGSGFTYIAPDGRRIRNKGVLKKLSALAVPPAWSEVWICANPHGHIQATGRDARGRKQYRYHPAFRQVRESTKYDNMIAFAESLPTIRAQLAKHMALRGLPREKILATVVHLLEATLIRVGNDSYAKANGSYGLTTLRNRHVKARGSELRFEFKGKSGRTWKLRLKDRRVTKIVRACQDLPGQDLFQYLDDAGERRSVTSSDINAYLKELVGRDVTAKDFRTWHGTVLAALALQAIQRAPTESGLKKNVKAAITEVAARLGNTPTICRKCYIHPDVIASYVEDRLRLDVRSSGVREKSCLGRRLTPEEAGVLSLLKKQARRGLGEKLRESIAALRPKRGTRHQAVHAA